MKIYAVMIVKDEVDIIVQTLEEAIKWCDLIYILDNGSTDGTWEEIINLSAKYAQIVLYKRDDIAFQDYLRGEIFNHYRHNSSTDDWWCRLDADEIYIDDPRKFLTKIPRSYQVVVAAFLQYYFTDKDLELYNRDPALYADHVRIEEKCHYYINNWAEPRFFRYRKNLAWKRDKAWPDRMGRVYPLRIRFKHYQYRSPRQIQKRLNIRREVKRQTGLFSHEMRPNLDWIGQAIDKRNSSSQGHLEDISWQHKIGQASRLNYDALDGNYILNEWLMPPLKQPFVQRLLGKLKNISKS